MTRLTLYTTLITGQLAFAAATLWLQAQPNMDEKNYLKCWYSIPQTARDDIVAMIASAPKGTTNILDYYKNLIDRNAHDIPAAIQSVGKLVNVAPTITNSLYQQITVERQAIEPDGEGVHYLTDSITRAEDLLKKDTLYPLESNLSDFVVQAIARTNLGQSSLRSSIDTLMSKIGLPGDFLLKTTVYDKLALALEKLNKKTGKPKPTITQALAELDRMSLGECEKHKALVDARSATKTLQEAINAVNGQPANKTYGLLGNLKTTATANGTPLAEHDIYRRLAKGIAHLNELLDSRITGWPSPDPANIGEITQEIIAKTPTTLSPSNPEDTGAGEDEGAGG
ncbi:MAG: hypothetical protein V6Z78_04975 [Holosporaceae bacterium]